MKHQRKSRVRISAKLVMAIVVLAVGLIYGKIQLSELKSSDVGRHIRKNFAVAGLKDKKPSLPLHFDFVVMAETHPEDKADYVFFEKKVEDTPEISVPIESTEIKYKEADGVINWDCVQLRNQTKKSIDPSALMKDYSAPARKSDKPQILIVHTHGTEAYSEIKASRTTDNEQNVIRVGDELAKTLRQKGFNVLHDVKQHDYPNYNGSYKNSLATIQWYIEHYPSLEIVLDIHRDAIEKDDGTKVAVTTKIEDKNAAQLMFVVGTDEGGLTHKNWQNNLKFAMGLQQITAQMYPNLMRPIDLRAERFNQHILPQCIIVEVGTHGNALNEALFSAKLLADAVAAYIK